KLIGLALVVVVVVDRKLINGDPLPHLKVMHWVETVSVWR
ncbi:MAG: hypothetical protein ACI9BC_002333, partial [Crocinitomicaceae bacterium]